VLYLYTWRGEKTPTQAGAEPAINKDYKLDIKGETTMTNQLIAELVESGLELEEATFIAEMDDEELIQFVADCGGDYESLPKVMQPRYLALV